MISPYIQKFLDDNNLKVGEKFNVVSKKPLSIEPKLYKITDYEGGQLELVDNGGATCVDNRKLLGLLRGNLHVVKPYWPKLGNIYWYVNRDGYVGDTRFNGGFVDLFLREHGLCRRTESEAIACKSAYLAYYEHLQAEKH